MVFVIEMLCGNCNRDALGNFLMQVVEEPTRKGVLLDLVFVNKQGGTGGGCEGQR